MSFRHIRIEQEGSVATLTLARPPVNALGRELVEDLEAACDTLSAGAPVRALIVAAEGRNFCAGADLKERQGMSGEEVRRWVPFLNGAFQRIATLPFPTIAAIQGVAAGGGFELALACDFRVLEESGRVGLLEVTLGIIPGAGGTQRLPRLIGPARAKRWIFAAGLHSGPEALMDGAIDFLAPEGGAIEGPRLCLGYRPERSSRHPPGQEGHRRRLRPSDGGRAAGGDPRVRGDHPDRGSPRGTGCLPREASAGLEGTLAESS